MTPAEHAAAQAALETLANRDLVRIWRSLDLSDARQATGLLLPEVRDVVAVYNDLAASVAADYYDAARETARAGGQFTARTGPTVPPEQIDALTRWSVTPIWSTDPRYGAALERLAGGAQRLIRKAERDTIAGNASRDPSGPRFVRVPSSDACAFCLMLASRGGVYRSDQEGAQYHDNCRCQTRPVWTPDDIPDINVRLADEWDAVTAGEPEQLAAWRAHVDGTRPNQHVTRN